MLKRLGFVVVVACGSAPPPKINTPADYQNAVGDLVAQVIDDFKTDGTNCEMLEGDLQALEKSAKFKATHDWGTSHPDGPKLAQEKIDAKKADFESAAGPALHVCGGQLAGVMQELVK